MMNPQGRLNFQEILPDRPGRTSVFIKISGNSRNGETPAARLAGEIEDKNTVKTPTMIPLMIPHR